jgi:hypothetical protein
MLLANTENLTLNHTDKAYEPRWIMASNRIEDQLRNYADSMKHFLHTQAFEEATRLAHKVETQYSCHYFDQAPGHFSLFRIFANAAEAHEALGDLSQARHFRKLALDQHIETESEVDLEIMCFFMI